MRDKENQDIAALILHVQSMSELLDNINACVFTKDLDGKYVYANADVAQLFQTPIEDIIGKDDSHFFDLDVSDELRQNDLNVLNNKAIVETEERNLVKSTGKIHTYKTVKKPLFDNDGNIIGLCGISTDISAQKVLEIENQKQKHLLDVIVNNVDAYIYMKDSNRHFRYVNSRTAELFGLPAEEIIGQLDSDVIPQELADHFWQTDKQVFETNEKITINETAEDADQTLHHYLSVKMPCDLNDDSNTLIGFSTEVTELYQLKEKFELLANTDELTGLYNRRYFFDNAKREFNRATRHQQSLAVISIDVDHFKAINDQYGHPVGDQALIKIAQLITPTIRAEDTFARIGGEEFSIMLPDTSKQQCQQAAERLRHLLDSQPILIADGLQLAVKISVGVSLMRATDSSFHDLYTRSDTALYQAKSSGRNQVHLIT